MIQENQNVYCIFGKDDIREGVALEPEVRYESDIAIDISGDEYIVPLVHVFATKKAAEFASARRR